MGNEVLIRRQLQVGREVLMRRQVGGKLLMRREVRGEAQRLLQTSSSSNVRVCVGGGEEDGGSLATLSYQTRTDLHAFPLTCSTARQHLHHMHTQMLAVKFTFCLKLVVSFEHALGTFHAVVVFCDR